MTVRNLIAAFSQQEDLNFLLTNRIPRAALTRLMADGVHRAPMTKFLATGGQTRDGETQRMAAIIDALRDD